MDPTPQSMLSEYRRAADDFATNQVKMFRSMSVKDQLELMFYMILHQNYGIQSLHARIDADEAKTVGMEAIKTPTQ